LINKTYNEMFQFFIDMRMKRDITEKHIEESIGRSSFLQYFFKQTVYRGEKIVFPEGTFKNSSRLWYGNYLGLNNFIGSPLYLNYVKYIRGDKGCENAKKTIEKYCALFESSACPYCIITEENPAASIVIFDEIGNYFIDIPEIRVEIMQEQLSQCKKQYKFNEEKKVIFFFNGTQSNYLEDIIQKYHFFGYDNVIMIDSRHCGPTESLLSLNDLPTSLCLRMRDIVMTGAIKILGKSENIPNGLFNILSRCSDSENFSFIHYVNGIKKSADKFIQLLPFSINYILEDDAVPIPLVFPATNHNVLKNLLKNMIAAKKNDQVAKGVNAFCEKIKIFDPRCFFSYLTQMERNSDPLLQEASDNGLDFFLQWIRDARRKHIEEYGFNLQEKIVEDCIKKILGAE